MPDWKKKFKPEYDYAKAYLGNAKNYDSEWQSLVKSLNDLMGVAGFDSSKSNALNDLRYKCKQLDKNGKANEDKIILKAVGGWDEKTGATTDSRKKMRAAALKMLRHTYLLKSAGNTKVWIHSLPTDFQDWATDHMNAQAGTGDAVRKLLRSSTEQFSEEQKKFLSSSTQEALAWSQKTCVILAEAANSKDAKKSAPARAVVKRWFADPATTDKELDGFIAKLQKGFKDITATLNRGQFILTDWCPLRGATEAAEVKWRNAEAFTFRSGGEGLDVVYIEGAFFKNSKGNVLSGQKNWTRIVVHELTHLVCGTEDVNKGNPRYAWYGIGPNKNFTGADAAKNADSWAFFAADCAGQLTDGERNTALTIK